MKSTAVDELPTQVTTAEEALESLRQLDLSMIRMKLADPAEGKGWDGAQLDAVEVEYRRFLALHLMFPGQAIVPCSVVDEMWHAHILDTQAYAPDCERVFGFFLHHFPYFGLRGDQDAADLATAFDRTIALYERSFGRFPSEVSSGAGRTCRTKCKPMKCK